MTKGNKKHHSESEIKVALDKKSSTQFQENISGKEASQKKSSELASSTQHTDHSTIKHGPSNRGK